MGWKRSSGVVNDYRERPYQFKLRLNIPYLLDGLITPLSIG